jgi:hypothetical protein
MESEGPRLVRAGDRKTGRKKTRGTKIAGRGIGRPQVSAIVAMPGIQRWRSYGDHHKFKVSVCSNCRAQFEEPEAGNMMCCPLCADFLWNKKNYPPQQVGLVRGGCPWCGRPPRSGKYCDEWCRAASRTTASRLYQRKKRGDPDP